MCLSSNCDECTNSITKRSHVEFSSFSMRRRTADGGGIFLEIPKFKSLKKVNWSISRKPPHTQTNECVRIVRREENKIIDIA